MSDQTLEVGATRTRPAATQQLHRPVRAVVAVIELILAAGAVWAAFPTWSAGIETVTSRLIDGTELTSTHYSGNWIGLAIVLGAVAGVLVVDAVRQLLLAFRAGRRRSRSAQPASDGASAS